MKFKLCGGLDCPDWILAEIASLSSISAIKVKQLATEVTPLKLTIYLSTIENDCPGDQGAGEQGQCSSSDLQC